MKSLRGQLLVATPQLPDENFFRTVVLLVEHTEDGALGVVLNRLANRSVAELWHEVSDEACDDPRPVNLGGPVSGPLIAIHTDESLAEMEILPGVYLAAQKSNLDRLVAQDEHHYRVYLGHSGWGRGQLEGELEQGAWLTTPATREYVFHDGDDLWETVAKHIGDAVLLESLRIKHVPRDPSLN
ncbi:MAG: YqgE/AlgH family protein [Planctomycetia bacterium]|jgi:putative transcriptional regulator|nr:YqgE/AlgH family protein [Planctomycetia bacterium]